MPTTEAELRIWNRLSVQEKSIVIVAFYVASAVFPWVSITAVFAFLAGRMCGIQVGKLNAEIEEEERQHMRSKLVVELGVGTNTKTSQFLNPIPEVGPCAGEEEGEQGGEE